MRREVMMGLFSVTRQRSFFPSVRAGLCAGVAVASMMLPGVMWAQDLSPAAPAAGAQTTGTQAPVDPTAPAAAPEMGKTKRQKLPKNEKVVQSKDTKRSLRKEKKMDPLVGKDANLPDKQLYDKAVIATKKGHFDVARLDLQTLLNTYPDSQYQMRAKLAIADSWYREGGTAALTQAEAEYADFRVFFPNAPEAAEAQMRIGDIYFRQMDKPDRDYAKAVHAQEEYRRMLTDYPESTLVPQAKQRLREVQEALATRESEIATFYASRENWPATIARYQTVSDTYPQYSHMDDVLVGMGDAYEAEARFVRLQKLPEAAKARLEKIYDDQAADAYRKVVMDHSASPHVEDARDRLAAMDMPIPAPTLDQIQASQALENSRAQYRLQDRAALLIFHKPDVVQAARMGEPTIADPKATLAPTIRRQLITDFNGALNPNAAAPKPAATATATAPADAAPAPAAPASAAPLTLNDVPSADAGANNSGSTTNMTPAGAPPAGGAGNSVGVEVLTPNANGTTTPTAGGLNAVGPPNSAPLPPVEKPEAAPDAINTIAPGTATPAAQAPRPDGKKTRPGFDKDDESSSRHKKKKGLNKINPF